MATPKTGKYEERLRGLLASDELYDDPQPAYFLTASAEQVADVIAASRLVLADILELGAERTGELRSRGGPISDLDRALDALDREAQR